MNENPYHGGSRSLRAPSPPGRSEPTTRGGRIVISACPPISNTTYYSPVRPDRLPAPIIVSVARRPTLFRERLGVRTVLGGIPSCGSPPIAAAPRFDLAKPGNPARRGRAVGLRRSIDRSIHGHHRTTKNAEKEGGRVKSVGVGWKGQQHNVDDVEPPRPVFPPSSSSRFSGGFYGGPPPFRRGG